MQPCVCPTDGEGKALPICGPLNPRAVSEKSSSCIATVVIDFAGGLICAIINKRLLSVKISEDTLREGGKQ
jgi:hypothetical protein